MGGKIYGIMYLEILSIEGSSGDLIMRGNKTDVGNFEEKTDLWGFHHSLE